MTRDSLASLLRLAVIAALIAVLSSPQLASAAPRRRRYNATADWLVQIAKEYYQHCQYAEALHEFKNALIVQPNVVRQHAEIG